MRQLVVIALARITKVRCMSQGYGHVLVLLVCLR